MIEFLKKAKKNTATFPTKCLQLIIIARRREKCLNKRQTSQLCCPIFDKYGRNDRGKVLSLCEMKLVTF